jgi:UDP-glucose 4-epimerase
MHVLLLGSAGFIGQHLAREFTSSERVARLDLAGHHAKGFAVPKAGCVHEGRIDADLLSRADRPDVVVWAIGGASVAASVRNPEADRERSIPPLLALLDLMAGAWHETRLVFLSSAAVYGASASLATSTSADPRPVSPYGEHKLLSEHLVRERLEVERFHLVRPFSVYGPGLARQLLWDALAKVDAGSPVFFGTGTETRDWLHVSDLARLVTDIAIAPAGFPDLLNAGTGIGTSVRETLRQLFAVYGTDAVPRFEAGSRAGDPDVLVASLVEQEAWRRYASIPLSEGIRSFCSWRRKFLRS